MPALTEIATPYGTAHLPALGPGAASGAAGPKSRLSTSAAACLVIVGMTGAAGEWPTERATPRDADLICADPVPHPPRERP